MNLTEEQKLQIMQALANQGLLGGGIGDLRPIWGQMNIDAQMQGQSYPQYQDWYKMVQQMRQTPNFNPMSDTAPPGPVGGTPNMGLMDQMRVLFGR